MSTTASGSVKTGGGGEGRWWMTGCNPFIYLDELEIGDTFVIWGDFGYISSSGAWATVVPSGAGTSYMRVTQPGSLTVVEEPCSGATGLLIHEVSEFDEPNWSCG